MADEVQQDSLDHHGAEWDQSLDQEHSANCRNQNQEQDYTLKELTGDLDCHPRSDRNQNQGQDQAQAQSKAQGSSSASQDVAGESAGSVPTLVITQAEEPAETPAVPPEPAIPTEPSISVEADMACGDLLSLRSDTLSLAGDHVQSRTSDDDDSTSVTASSVISLFQRVQLDPLEKEWLRSSALGDGATQRRLLRQDGSLPLKKTALHWAAKQGRLETVDMMLLAGADVNARSHGGYTALHLASIHGHQHVVQALINTHNARTSLRDYHGRTAAYYWSGSGDLFERRDPQPGVNHSGVTFSRGRHTQRRVLPSLLLTRSRSHSQLVPDLRTSQELWDLQV